jgi:hypothetical protein
MARSCGCFAAGKMFDIRLWMVVPLLTWILTANPGGGLLRAADKPARSGAKSSLPAKAAEHPDADDDPADDSDSDMDEDLTALIVPPGLMGTVKEGDRTKFSQELRGMLAEGMRVDDESQAAARRHFEASHLLVPADPRAAYAYGVTLLAQKRSKESLDQFRAAAQQSKAPFLPALEAIAWVNVSKNEYAKGLPAVLDLAHKIEETKATWPTDHDRLRSAEWLGRMVGFLAGPGKSSDQAVQIEKLDADVDRLLTYERKAAFERGRKFVLARQENLKALLARPTNEVLDELKQKRQEILDAAQAADAEVKQLEDELREIKKPHDTQIAELNHEIRLAAQKSKKAQREMPDAEDAVEMLSVPPTYSQVRTMGRYRVPYATARAETAQEKKSRETQLASAKQKLQQAQAAYDQAKQELSDLKSQKEHADADFRKAAAEKRPLLSAARRKAQDLAARAREAEHGKLTPEKLKTRVTALETYVPLDPETEKNRLLATLKTSG